MPSRDRRPVRRHRARTRISTWIVNSRNTADEDAVRTLASLAGFTPRIAHEIDSLDLVEDLIVAGYGVGLLPIGRPTHPGVTVLPLADPTVVLTAYAVDTTRPIDVAAAAGGAGPAAAAAGQPLPRPDWPRPAAA